MKIQSILMVSMVALGCAPEAEASKFARVADPLIRRAPTTAIECVPRHIRVKHANAAVEEMISTSRTDFLKGTKPVLRCKDRATSDEYMKATPFDKYDFNMFVRCFGHDSVDFGELVKSFKSVNFVSLSNPLSPASFALMDALSTIMKPDEGTRRCHIFAEFIKERGIVSDPGGNSLWPKYREQLGYHDGISSYFREHNPIQRSLDNLLVLMVPEAVFERQKEHLWSFGDGLGLPYTMMIAGVKPEEAYWLRQPADDAGIVSIHEGRFPNQLAIFKNGDLAFSADFSMSTLDVPGTDMFVWMLIERLHKRVLRVHDPKDPNSFIRPTGFPEFTKSKYWEKSWDFAAPYRKGYVKETRNEQKKPIWSIHSEDNYGNRFQASYPRIPKAHLDAEKDFVAGKN